MTTMETGEDVAGGAGSYRPGQSWTISVIAWLRWMLAYGLAILAAWVPWTLLSALDIMESDAAADALQLTAAITLIGVMLSYAVSLPIFALVVGIRDYWGYPPNLLISLLAGAIAGIIMPLLVAVLGMGSAQNVFFVLEIFTACGAFAGFMFWTLRMTILKPYKTP